MRFTRFGLFYIFFTIAVGAAAINTGNNLLYLILGIQLSLIIVSGFLSDSGLWGLRSQWHPADDLFVARPARWMIDVHKGWFPAVLVTISGEWSSDITQQAWIPWIAHRQSLTATMEITPRQRGLFFLQKVPTAPRSRSAYSKKFTRNCATIPRSSFPAFILWILTNCCRKRGMALARCRRNARAMAPCLGAYAITGRGIRCGAWGLESRGQTSTLDSERNEKDTSDAAVLFIDAWPRNGAEHFTSFIASILWAAMKTNRTIELFTPDHHFPGGASLDHYRQVWRYLALIDVNRPTPETPSHIAKKE